MMTPARIKLALLFLFAPMTLSAATFEGPDTCAACHAQEYADWKGSVHAKANEGRFKTVWTEMGRQPGCLRCHVTGQQAGTLQFAFAGVTCESCHGAMSSGHPGESKMPIPVSSEMCKTCHAKTFKEWRLSKHGQKNIRCFDCHNVHKQGLRAGGGDALCGSCHPTRLKDFAHATHKTEGLHCSTCHMPATGSTHDAIEGTGAEGHSLSVGVEVCSRCHEETVHKGSNLQTLRKEVSSFQQQVAVSGGKSALDLQEENRTLAWKLSRSKNALWLVALLGAVAGLLLGWLACWYILHRKPQ